ncbi:unnamed protein product [Lymnaea stagnalis]|uniref:LicD/FKTN/FKRP nucleotidyltransferase domain-containing protein n=1 Tax=Lymnaea stagnalis TaxID=6523 RepID=A0AAV2HTL7_LYMST
MVNWSTFVTPTILRRTWNGKCKILSLTVTFLTCGYLTLFVIPVRNVILSSVIEYGWRDMETSDLIRIHFCQDKEPEGILSSTSCPVLHKPQVNVSDIITSSLVSHDHLLFPEVQRRVLEKGHGRFLPALNLTQKVEILLLYKVAAAALESVGVQHFLVDGSLLGLSRHGGFVPWDDDLDVSVFLDSWHLVKKALSCIEGFTLYKPHFAHWKFHYKDRLYPFLDIFFYMLDESYVWAASYYTRITYIYPKRFVFPLGESIFEGMKVPVPKDSLSIARRIYEYDLCFAYRGHLKHEASGSEDKGYSISNVSCQELSYMYRFY